MRFKKHAAPPWLFKPDLGQIHPADLEDEDFYIVHNEERTIALVFDDDEPTLRLICAAPQLHAACRLCDAVLNGAIPHSLLHELGWDGKQDSDAFAARVVRNALFDASPKD